MADRRPIHRGRKAVTRSPTEGPDSEDNSGIGGIAPTRPTPARLSRRKRVASKSGQPHLRDQYPCRQCWSRWRVIVCLWCLEPGVPSFSPWLRGHGCGLSGRCVARVSVPRGVRSQRAQLAADAQTVMVGRTKEQVLACMGQLPTRLRKEPRGMVLSLGDGSIDARQSSGEGWAPGASQSKCTINMTMVGGRVTKLSFVGPDGELVIPNNSVPLPGGLHPALSG